MLKKAAILIVVLIIVVPLFGQSPRILSIDQAGLIVWTNGTDSSGAVLQRADTIRGPWLSVGKIPASVGTNNITIPNSQGTAGFFRIALDSVAADELVLHLDFNNDFSAGIVSDQSGKENDGLRYGKPCCPDENWPSPAMGPDKSQAAEFSWSYDGYGLYGKSGDYIGVPWSPDLTNMTSATISIWAYYYTALSNQITFDHVSTLLSAGKDLPGTWTLGRNYGNYTSFTLYTSPFSATEAVSFPDAAPNGSTGGWHLYTITFEKGSIQAYFDGELVSSEIVSVQALTLGGYYLGISGWTFNATPELDMAVDGHPNNAWFNGAIDDLRIYRRALSGEQIREYFLSFDLDPPSTPANLFAVGTGPSQVKLTWLSSEDNFKVDGYVIRRDGTFVSKVSGTAYFDHGLEPDTEYSYSIEAVDHAGNASALSSSVNISTKPADDAFDFIIDDADGEPWLKQIGSWFPATDAPSYWGRAALSDSRRDKGKMIEFRPAIPEAGEYDVYVWYPGHQEVAHVLETAVPYDIIRNGQTNVVTVNQSKNFGQWNLLGKFHFDSGTNALVRLRTDTTTQFVIADAVRFVK